MPEVLGEGRAVGQAAETNASLGQSAYHGEIDAAACESWALAVEEEEREEGVRTQTHSGQYLKSQVVEETGLCEEIRLLGRD